MLKKKKDRNVLSSTAIFIVKLMESADSVAWR